jgi:hypothetical protein
MLSEWLTALLAALPLVRAARELGRCGQASG